MRKNVILNDLRKFSFLCINFFLASCQNPSIYVSNKKEPITKGKQGASEDGKVPTNTNKQTGFKSELETLNDWVYFSEKDFGVRDDNMGDGRFSSSRNGGLHSGIDYYYSIGTAFKSPCSGKYFSGSDPSGYGHWVQIVCPILYGSSKKVYASILFGHMQNVSLTPKTSLVPAEAGTVNKGQKIGSSGNSGNASNSAIQPHVHLETAIHSTEKNALEEAHLKVAGGSLSAEANEFLQTLKSTCVQAKKIRISKFNVGTRIDPYLLFKCLSGEPKSTTSQNSGKRPSLKSVYFADD
jgi:Peptidase family M23